MYNTELQRIVFSSIHKNDPYRATKLVDLKNWCRAFLILFSSAGQAYLSFFVDILSDESSWEIMTGVHPVKLNRRTVAKKMVELNNSKGKPNPLDNIRRYQVACWCCLEHDIFDLFEQMKQEYKISDDDSFSIKRLVKTLSTGTWSDPLTGFWSHVMGNCVENLQLGGKHLLEYGLNNALRMHRKQAHMYAGYVEAVEFFWNRIKSLSEEELSDRKKHEIFMKTTVFAASYYCTDQPEIFEFCINQLSLDMYPEFLKRELSENNYYNSFNQVHKIYSFHIFLRLFDSLKPSDVPKDMYHTILITLTIQQYSQYYKKEAEKVFLHIWRKEGFENHRAFVLRKELNESGVLEQMLLILIGKQYMELLWVVLDEANSNQINEFMDSKVACYIRSKLEINEDKDSLNRFLSYRNNYNQ